jgi:8-oxo-dGTP pyrophosphatase MutT (NUDIX family)
MASSYVLVIRNHQGFEVLLAQRNVIDFRRTLPADNSTLHIYDNPGEYVLPGGEIRAGERPAQAALRRFCELTRVPMPRVAALQKLHEIPGEAYFWLLWPDNNPWLILRHEGEVHRLNKYYKERDGAVYFDEDTKRLMSDLPTEDYGELHSLRWVSPGAAAEMLSPRGWLSDWQEEQYKLVQSALPFYRNYNILEIHNNRRAPSAKSENALQYLVNNPLVTSVQVYKDRDHQRLSPMLTEGAGQIIHLHGGEVRLNGRGMKFTEEPLMGNSYFVVAYNGKELFSHHTMVYMGREDDGVYMFIHTNAADDVADEPDMFLPDPPSDV